MRPPLKYILLDQTLWLSAERAVFWEEEQSLILADLHFGKTGHFRKSGIGVPQTIYREDLQRLVALVQFFKARQLIVVGDMFHSASNNEHNLFERWRNDLPSLQIHLIKGNHDILSYQWYQHAGITVHVSQLTIGDFMFMHDAAMPVADGGAKYLFSGHIHPGVTLHHIARQALHFPCFHFSYDCCTLPAFSRFTGATRIRPQKEDRVFAIVEDNVIAMQ